MSIVASTLSTGIVTSNMSTGIKTSTLSTITEGFTQGIVVYIGRLGLLNNASDKAKDLLRQQSADVLYNAMPFLIEEHRGFHDVFPFLLLVLGANLVSPDPSSSLLHLAASRGAADTVSFLLGVTGSSSSKGDSWVKQARDIITNPEHYRFKYTVLNVAMMNVFDDKSLPDIILHLSTSVECSKGKKQAQALLNEPIHPIKQCPSELTRLSNLRPWTIHCLIRLGADASQKGVMWGGSSLFTLFDFAFLGPAVTNLSRDEHKRILNLSWSADLEHFLGKPGQQPNKKFIKR
ncbi:hypothetical protein B0H66DRAFT_644431 [Apodospora peruviana]|uniref:Ankyrin repeat protein n=1 Tax=Apodospora peruviana TaxID=516989 RepID=A0AAE0HSK2_9PEZI|nr:hypothetical protein B0H66DRAFT_644431 [Apodospora peruviana]